MPDQRSSDEATAGVHAQVTPQVEDLHEADPNPGCLNRLSVRHVDAGTALAVRIRAVARRSAAGVDALAQSPPSSDQRLDLDSDEKTRRRTEPVSFPRRVGWATGDRRYSSAM